MEKHNMEPPNNLEPPSLEGEGEIDEKKTEIKKECTSANTEVMEIEKKTEENPQDLKSSLNKRNMPQLKRLLEELKLKKSGKKEEIVLRIIEYSSADPDHLNKIQKFLVSDDILLKTSVKSEIKREHGHIAKKPKIEDHLKKIQELHFELPPSMHSEGNFGLDFKKSRKKLFVFEKHNASPSYGTLIPLNHVDIKDNFELHYEIEGSLPNISHHFAFFSKKPFSVYFADHKELLNYNSDTDYECAPVCPKCHEFAETYAFNDNSKKSNPLAKFLCKHLDPFKLVKPENDVGNYIWNLGKTVMRVCKQGDVVITIAEESKS